MKKLIRPVLLALTLMCSQAACMDLTGVEDVMDGYIRSHFPYEGVQRCGMTG